MKRNKIMSLYFSACAFGTGLFIPFGVLSLLFSFSKRNIAGSGISAIGKLGKNVLTPTLSNALPGVGLAISALDLFAKDNTSKTKEYSNNARDNNYFYESILPKPKPYVPLKIDPITSYEYESILPKPKPYVPINLDDFKKKFDF